MVKLCSFSSVLKKYLSKMLTTLIFWKMYIAQMISVQIKIKFKTVQKTQHAKRTHSYVAAEIFLWDKVVMWISVKIILGWMYVTGWLCSLIVNYFQDFYICSSLALMFLMTIIEKFFYKNLRLLSRLSKLVYIYFTFVSSNESFFSASVFLSYNSHEALWKTLQTLYWITVFKSFQ
jgi:hypothetical protein